MQGAWLESGSRVGEYIGAKSSRRRHGLSGLYHYNPEVPTLHIYIYIYVSEMQDGLWDLYSLGSFIPFSTCGMTSGRKYSIARE